MPFQNKPVQKLKFAVLPPELPCFALVTHSGEILTTDKSHEMKSGGIKKKKDAVKSRGL
jgi:hypothetical protein